MGNYVKTFEAFMSEDFENKVEELCKQWVIDNKKEEEHAEFNEFLDDKSYLYFVEIEHPHIYKKIVNKCMDEEEA